MRGWPDKLRRTLATARGARLGEAAVVSRQVHTLDPTRPGEVNVLTHADAGQAFYGRAALGEVAHVDVFHAVGRADHRRLAGAVAAVLGDAPAGGGRGRLADYADIQTGTGGGRITGDLGYGQRPSLLASHLNHVHLALLLPDGLLPLLLPVVAAVEAELRRQGLAPRRIDRLHHPAAGGAPLDLSPYMSDGDSLLHDPQAPRGGRGTGGAAGAGGFPGVGGSLATGGSPGCGGSPDAGGSRGASGPASAATGQAGGAVGAGGGLPALSAGAAGAPGGDPLADEARLQAALALARRFGSPDEVAQLLNAAQRGDLPGSGPMAVLARQLEAEGLLRRSGRGSELSEQGRELQQYLSRHLREVRLRFSKLLRRAPGVPGSARWQRPAPPSPRARWGRVAGAVAAPPGVWLGAVAVPETVRAAVRRAWLTRAAGAAPAGVPGAVPGTVPGAAPGAAWRLERSDVHVELRSGQAPLSICLLIDASASMAGRRLVAAKHLARHLVLSTRDRVSVVAFQERSVCVQAPFTRDYGQIEAGLARIQPMGLTPLALGLSQGLELVRDARVRHPLLLLITDGIPTVPSVTLDPLADALAAARQLQKARVPLGIIGLQPSRRYLSELAKAAGGSLHVVDELDTEALVAFAHRERRRYL